MSVIRLFALYAKRTAQTLCIQNSSPLKHSSGDAARSVAKLDIFEYEKPIGIQIFGHNIEVMRESVEITERVQPDIIDINYGCPSEKGDV